MVAGRALLHDVAALLDRVFLGHPTAQLFAVMIFGPLVMNMVQVAPPPRLRLLCPLYTLPVTSDHRRPSADHGTTLQTMIPALHVQATRVPLCHECSCGRERRSYAVGPQPAIPAAFRQALPCLGRPPGGSSTRPSRPVGQLHAARLPCPSRRAADRAAGDLAWAQAWVQDAVLKLKRGMGGGMLPPGAAQILSDGEGGSLLPPSALRSDGLHARADAAAAAGPAPSSAAPPCPSHPLHILWALARMHS